MNKTTIVFLVVLMVALVGCSDKPSDYNTYTAPPQSQDTVGGGCGLSSVEKPNILGNPYEAKQEM